MGMDGVEIAMDIEEQFGIKLSDAEASTVATVGDAFLLICRKLNLPSATPTEPVLLPDKILSALSKVGANANALRHTTCLDDIIPVRKRYAAWKTLSRILGDTIPLPDAPKVGCNVAIVITAGLAISGIALFGVPGLIGGVTLGIALGASLYAVLQRLCPTFASSCRTVGDLIVWTTPVSTTADAWRKLVRIIADDLAVKPEDIRPDSQFVKDLGLR